MAVNGHHPGMQRVRTRRPHGTVETRPLHRYGQRMEVANPLFCRVSAGSTTKFTNRSRTFCSSSTSALEPSLPSPALPYCRVAGPGPVAQPANPRNRRPLNYQPPAQ